MWYNIIIFFLLCAIPASAQTLDVESQLRLEILQLKQTLAQERELYVGTLQSYSQCVSDSFTKAKPIFDSQLEQAYKEWLTDVERKNPGMTWDGQKLVMKPLVEVKK